MNSRIQWAAASLTLFTIMACNQQSANESKPIQIDTPAGEAAPKLEAEAPPAPIKMGGPLSPEQPKTELSQIPVAEELENEAANSIGVDNIEAELDRIEAEIVRID